MVRIPHFFIPNSMPMSVLNTYTVLTKVFFCSSIIAQSFKSSKNNRCFNLYSFFSDSYHAFTFLRIKNNGTMLTANNNGDILSPWNITLLILTSARSSPLHYLHDNLHCCILFSKNVLKFSAILNISMYSFTHLCGTRSYAFL